MKPGRVFASSEAKVSEEWSPLLRAYGTAYGEALREVYLSIFAKGAKRQGVRHELIVRGWKEDEADSIIDSATAAQEAAVESTKLALEGARAALVRVEEKLAWATETNAKKRRRCRHGLSRRRDILTARVARFERRLEDGDVRACFGGKKLAVAGNDPVAHGYESRDAWRGAWDRARSGLVYLKGDTEASFANSCAKISFAASGGTLRLRVPDLVSHGVRLRDLSGGEEWVEIACSGFAYGRGELEAALAPGESSAEAKRRWEHDRHNWPDIEPLLAEAAMLARATKDLTGKAARWARGLPSAPPATPYKAKLASAAVSVRICWRERAAAWYVVASAELEAAGVVLRPSRSLRRRFSHVLGVDLNPSHLAWSVIDADGNPLAWGRIALDLSGTTQQNNNSIGRAAAELVSVAAHYGAPIAHEKLDFSKSRANLRYGCSKRTAKLLSSFAYNKFFATLASRCRREGVARIPVNPAWTSVLGQANYAGVHGVSVDQGAACVIARRSLDLRERVRPQLAATAVARQSPRSGAGGHMLGIRALAKALPKRRSTWEPSGLCRRQRQHSAPTSLGPLGVSVTGEAGDSPVLLLASAPNAGSPPTDKAVPCSDTVAAATFVGVRTDGDTRPVGQHGPLSNTGQLRK